MCWLTRCRWAPAGRLSRAGGRTLGNRYQHLEAAYAENQEVQSDLQLMRALGVDVPQPLIVLADRLGGMVYGLLRSEVGRGKR